MVNFKALTTMILACLIILASTASANGTTYAVGVIKGQWIKYGNWMSVDPSNSSLLNETDWMKIEIIDVADKNVTLRVSGMYKNGTASGENSSIVNIETGWTNQSDPYGSLLIVAANLVENDTIGTFGNPPTQLKVNKTETRNYLGVDRTVNIVNLTQTLLDYMRMETCMIFDKASGILLEFNFTQTGIPNPALKTQMFFSIIDTNIYSTGIAAWLQDNMIYIAAVIVIIIIAITIYGLKGRKPEATEPPTETPTTQP